MLSKVIEQKAWRVPTEHLSRKTEFRAPKTQIRSVQVRNLGGAWTGFRPGNRSLKSHPCMLICFILSVYTICLPVCLSASYLMCTPSVCPLELSLGGEWCNANSCMSLASYCGTAPPFLHWILSRMENLSRLMASRSKSHPAGDFTSHPDIAKWHCRALPFSAIANRRGFGRGF